MTDLRPGHVELYGRKYPCDYQYTKGQWWPTRIDWDRGEKMFNTVQKPKAGECPARRCTAAPAAPDGNPYALCDRHLAEWAAEGRPELGGAPDAKASPAAALGVTPDLRAEVVQPIEVEAFRLRDRMAGQQLTISTPEQAQAIGSIAKLAQSKISEIETQRKRATKPLNVALREINAWFKPATAAYTAVKAQCHAALMAYAQAAAQARAAALQSGDHDAAMAVVPAELPQGTHARRHWTFRVTDPAAVPREFLVVNAAAVQAVVDAQREKTTIPGIEAYEDATLVTRGS